MSVPRINSATHLALSFLLATIWFCDVSAETASQRFTLSVPAAAQVVTPPASEMVSNLSSGSESFPPQLWTLASSSSTGLVATFSFAEPFSHDSIPDTKMDASVSLRITETNGSGQWTLPQHSATTNHDSGDDSATVQVESDGNGSAQVELQVGCINSNDAPAGTYHATLTCTVAVP